MEGWGSDFFGRQFVSIHMVYTFDIGVCIYKIYLCRIIILWVYYFQQVGEFPNFFQNLTGGMIFKKMAANFTVLEGIFETQFQI